MKLRYWVRFVALAGIAVIGLVGCGEREDARMTKTASGLKMLDQKEGTGEAVQPGDAVSVHYTGWLKDGKKFDSSFDHGQPFDLIVGAGLVIKGWDEGLVGMKAGGKRKLV